VVVLVVSLFVVKSVSLAFAHNTACSVFKDVLGVKDGLDSGGCVENGCGLVGSNVVGDDSHEHVRGSHVPLIKGDLRGLCRHLGRYVLNSRVMLNPLGGSIVESLADFAKGAVELLPFRVT
jgi:hypothetical protein